jgi:hypothetical protein
VEGREGEVGVGAPSQGGALFDVLSVSTGLALQGERVCQVKGRVWAGTACLLGRIPALRPLCNLFAISLQPLCNRFAISLLAEMEHVGMGVGCSAERLRG